MPSAEDALSGLRKAVRTTHRAESALERARDALGEAIAEALRSGVKQVEVARETGFTREHVRRIAREHGVAAGGGTITAEARVSGRGHRD